MNTHRSAPTKASTKPPRHQQLRTRDENQERAYIAASRRTDRSIEARLQSAHKASELHRKRTGKALRITEQIVFNDETYEEEDSWLPSRFLLGPQLQTSSADLNSRVEAFLEQKIAMSTYVAAADRQQQNKRWGEIDRLFAESFPNAAQTARRLAEDMVPSTPSVLLKKALEQQQSEEQDIVQDSFETTRGPDERTGLGMRMRTHEMALDVVVPSSDLTSDDVGMSDGSFFTADLPAEVLMFLGHGPGQDQGSGPDGKGYYDDCLKSHGREDVSLGTFVETEFLSPASNGPSAEISVDAQSPNDGQHHPMWSDELDAYLDSSAWLDFPITEEQASAFT